MPWLTHAHSFSALTGRSWVLCAKKHSWGNSALAKPPVPEERQESMKFSWGSLNKFLCIPHTIYNYGYVRKQSLGPRSGWLIWIFQEQIMKFHISWSSQ